MHFLVSSVYLQATAYRTLGKTVLLVKSRFGEGCLGIFLNAIQGLSNTFSYLAIAFRSLVETVWVGCL